MVQPTILAIKSSQTHILNEPNSPREGSRITMLRKDSSPLNLPTLPNSDSALLICLSAAVSLTKIDSGPFKEFSKVEKED
jgi:hypothetical protein